MTAAPPVPLAPPVRACSDCGAALAGPYCAACGLKAEPLRQPAHHFVRDAAAEAVSYDGRVWRTFAALLFRPGALTAAYAEGRRQRYLRPLRVYLTSTLLFFFLLSTVDPVGRVQRSLGDDDGRADTVRVAERLTATRARLATADSAPADSTGAASTGADSTGAGVGALARPPVSVAVGRDSVATLGRRPDARTADGRAEAAQARDDALAFADSLRDADPDEERLDRQRARAEIALLSTWPPDSAVAVADLDDATAILFPDRATVKINGPTWITEGAAVRMIRDSRTAGDRADAFAAFSRNAIRHVPTVMFLLLPLFALLLKGLYARRGWTLAEHVVFGLHTHAFAFVVFAAMTGIAWAASGSDAAGIALLVLLAAIPLYVVLAQKRFYGQSWRKTVAKTVLLGSAYVTALMFGLVGVVVLAAVFG